MSKKLPRYRFVPKTVGDLSKAHNLCERCGDPIPSGNICEKCILKIVPEDRQKDASSS